MGFMQYSEAHSNFGPKAQSVDTLQTLRDLITNSEQLLYTINHPRHKGIYAEIDYHLNIPIYQGICSKAFGVIAAEDDRLVIVQKRSEHWHKHEFKTKIARDAQKELFTLFAERVAVLMAK